MKIPKNITIPTEAIAFIGGGAALGTGAKAIIGGAGLAAMGSAVAVPMTLAGAALGLLGYASYRLGQWFGGKE